MFGSWKGFGLCTALGIVTCYLPYLLYTYGLTGLETGKASILASFEPVVATLVGIFVFHEKLTPLSALGCVCVQAPAENKLNPTRKPSVPDRERTAFAYAAYLLL